MDGFKVLVGAETEALLSLCNLLKLQKMEDFTCSYYGEHGVNAKTALYPREPPRQYPHLLIPHSDRNC